MADNAVKIPFTEAAAPATPAASKVVVYAKTDGLMYSKDDAGVETLMSGGSSGSVATDAIWDAVGDTVVGSGANTAVKRKNNDGAAAAPAVTDDSAAGYAVGSRWINTTADKEYVALDVSVGAAVWTETTQAGSGAPTDATYVTTTANGTLSAEVVRPDLADNVSGSAVDMSAAATGTGVTANAQTGFASRVEWTNASFQYWDAAAAAATGDFDYRCRIVSAYATTPASTSAPIFIFGVTDSARTTGTMLGVRVFGAGPSTTYSLPVSLDVGQTASGILINRYTYPIVVRLVRVGTTVTAYYSPNDGISWATLGNTTSSLNVAKVGIWAHPNSNTKSEALVHYVRSV